MPIPEGVHTLTGVLDGVFWIYDIHVDPERRGQGLGQKVLDQILSYADANDYAVCLAVGEDIDGYEHDRLVRWYRRNGFVDRNPAHPDEYQMIRPVRLTTD